jgi:hypothetical protein
MANIALFHCWQRLMEISMILSGFGRRKTNPIIFSPQIYLGVINYFEKTKPIKLVPSINSWQALSSIEWSQTHSQPFRTAKGTMRATGLAQPHSTTIRTTSSMSL